MPTVSVAPTETVVATLDVSSKKRVCLQVVNLDGSQTFSGTLYLRTLYETAWAPSSMPDFQGVAAGGSVAPVIDVDGISVLELRGSMSGAGGSVRWSLT